MVVLTAVVEAKTLPRSLHSVAGAPQTAWKRKRRNVKTRTLKTAGCGTQHPGTPEDSNFQSS